MVREVSNRPANDPAREAEDITEFRSSAPGLPLYKLGGGLMKECVNLKIKNGRLKSRDKMKLYHGNENMPDILSDYSYKGKFFIIPYKGTERKYWIVYATQGSGNGEFRIYWLNDGSWNEIHRNHGSMRGGRQDMRGFNVFRMNNLFNTSLWVISIDSSTSVVLDNKETPIVRRLGIRNVVEDVFVEARNSNYWRAIGYDLVEIQDGMVIRSSGVYTTEITSRLMRCKYNNNDFMQQKLTHLRVWLSDKIYNMGFEENEGKTNANPLLLYPMAEFDMANSIDQNKTRNGIEISINFYNENEFDITFDDNSDSDLEPSFGSIKASTQETMNLIPMPNAQCLFNGILFGINEYDSGVIAYSSNPGTIFQEQTTALKVLQAGVGNIFSLVPTNTGILAFGTKGIARVASLGGGDFVVSKIASLDLSGMKAISLPGLGAICVGNGRVIFVDENTFEAGETFMGLPLGDMLGGLANDIQAISVADGKAYIIAGDKTDGIPYRSNRLFCVDLDSVAMTEIEIRDSSKDIYPVDLFSNDNSTILISCVDYAGGDLFILSAQEGNYFEDSMYYRATFCESSEYGFINHTSTQVLARLGKCSNLVVYLNGGGDGKYPEGEIPLEFEKLKKPNIYQDYFVPATKYNIAKTVEIMLSFFSASDGSGRNDGLEILSVKLTRLRQNEVSGPSFNSAGG